MKRINIFITVIFIILALIPICYGFYYIDKYGVNVPLDDQWDTIVPRTIQYYEGNFDISSLIHEHNDSRSFFSSALTVFVSVLTKMNIKMMFFIGYLFYILVILFIIYWLLKEKLFNKTYYLLFILPILYYAFNPYYLYRFIYNLGGIASLLILFALLTIYLLDLSKCQDSNKKSYFLYASSLVFGILCTFSGAPGLSIWFVGIAQILIQKTQKKIKKLIIWAISGAFVFYCYYIALGFKTQGIHGTQGYASYIMTALLFPLNKFLCFLGVIGAEVIHTAVIALFFGAIIVGIFLLLIWNNKNSLSLDKYSKWYALLIFGTLTSLELTLTRSGSILNGEFGPPNAIFYIPADRHSLVIFLPIICIYVLALLYSVNSTKDSSIQRNDINITISKSHWNFLLMGMILVLMLCGAVLHSLPGINLASNSHEQNIKNEYYLLNYNTTSDNNLTYLHPKPSTVRKYAQELEQLKLGIFSNQTIGSTNLQLF